MHNHKAIQEFLSTILHILIIPWYSFYFIYVPAFCILLLIFLSQIPEPPSFAESSLKSLLWDYLFVSTKSTITPRVYEQFLPSTCVTVIVTRILPLSWGNAAMRLLLHSRCLLVPWWLRLCKALEELKSHELKCQQTTNQTSHFHKMNTTSPSIWSICLKLPLIKQER